jgi:hypothetical protein
MWSMSLAFAWIRTPARRGASIRRWRDLRAPAPKNTRESKVVDLSHRSAAFLVALRAGSLVRGVVYLSFIACGVLHPGPIVVIVALASMLWVYNHWQQVADAVFSTMTKDNSIAFGESAWAYYFPSHRRGQLWNLAESWPAMALSVTGIGLLLAASLPLAYTSDTLITPVPGIYVEHSHLPFWVIGLVLWGVGALLASSGAWVDRAIKRRAMRRETVVPSSRPKRPRMVFLRPFGAEELRVPAHQGPRRDGFALLLPRREEFLEDVVTWLLWSCGEVLAIAKPGAGMTKTVGAAHHPVQRGKDWMAAVSKLLRTATAIVLVPGTTPGVAWEQEQVQGNPDFARKALIVNPEPADARSFLAAVGASADQARELHGRRLLALAAVPGPTGPKLLCGSLAEDVDFEAAVEWFLREELPEPSPFRAGWRILSSLAGRALGLSRGAKG